MVEINEQGTTDMGEGSTSRDLQELNDDSLVLTDHQEQDGMFIFYVFLSNHRIITGLYF